MLPPLDAHIIAKPVPSLIGENRTTAPVTGLEAAIRDGCFDPEDGSAFQRYPYPFYDQIRKDGPIVLLNRKVGYVTPRWLVVGHDEAVAILQNHQRFQQTKLKNMPSQNGEDDPIAAFRNLFMVFLDEQAHSDVRTRALKTAFFAKDGILHLEQQSRQLAAERIAILLKKGSFDLVNEYTATLPTAAIANVLGIRGEEAVAQMTDWTAKLLPLIGVARIQKDDHVMRTALAEYQAFFDTVFRSPNRTDVAEEILNCGDTLQAQATVLFLFLAGHGTSRDAMANWAYAAMKNSGEWDKLVSDPNLLPNAVMEGLRYDTSVQATSRRVVGDFSFEGIQFKDGEIVTILLGAALRDPRKVTDRPNRFLIDREPLPGSYPLMFGAGVHRCLGARMALEIMKVGIGSMVFNEAGKRLKLNGKSTIASDGTTRGFSEMQVCWS